MLKFKRIISKLLFGTELPQEYLCLAMEELKDPIKVMFRIKGKEFVKEVTRTHLFLGYQPLMIGISSLEKDPIHQTLLNVNIIYLEFSFSNKIIAAIHLKPLEQRKLDASTLFIFEGVKGEHKFLSAFNRWTNKVRYEMKAKRKDNVFLSGNRYEQVQIAYAVPRKISIITLGDGSVFNMLPTDLHGELENEYYAISLRHQGKASKQVEELKRIVLSTIKPEYFSETYSLGKNHMQELRSADHFKFQQLKSEKFNLPLPETINGYLELEWKESFINEIHKVHIFKIVNRKIVEGSGATLGHIHKFYAQWRANNMLETNYLIR